MKTYPNLIKEVCRTERTIENVSRAISVLIRWAQSGITTNTYGDFNLEIGQPKNFRPGVVLGLVHEVLSKFRELTGEEDIPELNVLVKKPGKDIPSDGFDVVYPGFNDYPIVAQKAIANHLSELAIGYSHWDTVLQALGLEPSIINSERDETLIRKGKTLGSGEGPQHKALKEYIASHPESIGLRNVTFKDTEYILLSGDRLDVYFELKDGTRVAVEVKSKISADDDILRGLYQCVKYKAVLDAENNTHGQLGNTRCLLVIEGTLSETNQQVKDSLGISVIEGFETK